MPRLRGTISGLHEMRAVILSTGRLQWTGSGSAPDVSITTTRSSAAHAANSSVLSTRSNRFLQPALHARKSYARNSLLFCDGKEDDDTPAHDIRIIYCLLCQQEAEEQGDPLMFICIGDNCPARQASSSPKAYACDGCAQLYGRRWQCVRHPCNLSKVRMNQKSPQVGMGILAVHNNDRINGHVIEFTYTAALIVYFLSFIGDRNAKSEVIICSSVLVGPYPHCIIYQHTDSSPSESRYTPRLPPLSIYHQDRTPPQEDLGSQPRCLQH